MALLTCCQQTFQNVAAYEEAVEEVETLKVQVHVLWSSVFVTLMAKKICF